MKRKDVLLLFALFLILVLLFVLFNNKSFFRDYYIDSNDNKVYVPRFSYFMSEDDNSISFYSLRFEDDINNSIDEFIENCDDCGYNISSEYIVEKDGLFRSITIKYKKN